MRPLLPVCFLLSALASHPAAAEDPIDCTGPSTTVAMNFCSDAAFKAADTKLNDVYKKVLANIAASDLDKPYDRASWEAALREAQRAWVAFRDADCKGAVPMEWSGGTGTSAAVAGCMTEKTDARAQDLMERYDLE